LEFNQSSLSGIVATTTENYRR